MKKIEFRLGNEKIYELKMSRLSEGEYTLVVKSISKKSNTKKGYDSLLVEFEVYEACFGGFEYCLNKTVYFPIYDGNLRLQQFLDEVSKAVQDSNCFDLNDLLGTTFVAEVVHSKTDTAVYDNFVNYQYVGLGGNEND